MGFPLVPLKFCQYNPLWRPKRGVGDLRVPPGPGCGGLPGVELLRGRALAVARTGTTVLWSRARSEAVPRRAEQR